MLILGFTAIDFTWILLSLFFLLAFCLHVFLSHTSAKCAQSRVCELFQDLIRYGKTKNSQRPSYVRMCDVPKRTRWFPPFRWFSHFYVVSVVWNGLLITVSLQTALLGRDLPLWLSNTLGFLTDSSAAAWKGVPLCTVVAQVLLWAHSVRRLVECTRVSVFSRGVIHTVQYAFGLGYYILLGLTLLCVRGPQQHQGPPVLWALVGGLLLFLWASLLQHRCLLLLAHLRTGEVQTLEHGLPRGGWFERVSCPHYFAELLIYLSVGVVLGGGALTWWLVVLYVLFNQALAAQLCHEFYHSTFQHYPRQRRAFLPFLF
ncbi:polyprenol reductase isoform X2 [Conger conger]|uniref:polyprenol reductase isoform X2 n=1 Tax=Conger conger TaxID=82655 RepID=UPI002A59D2BD|nr:polyprenol reductase isoform X2 [Conger conger]